MDAAAPGWQEHFPPFAPRSVDFDLFSSASARSGPPSCVSESYKGFPARRAEEGRALGLVLSVLL